MTPFALLDPMVKAASPEPFPFAPMYQPGRVPQAVAPVHGAPGKGWTWGDTGELALDIAAGSNPFTGVPYYGYKAIKDFSDGNFWSGVSNLGWGALSFLPGVTSTAKGVVGGASRLASKVTPGVIKSLQTGKAVERAGATGKIFAPGAAAGFGGMAGSYLKGEGAQPAPTGVANAAAQTSSDPYEQAAKHIDSFGLPKSQ